jgi:hypothetical protein
MFGADFWAIATLIQIILKAIEAVFGQKNIDKGYTKLVSKRPKKKRTC